MCHDAHESLAAVVMLQGANHDKHGSLKATMQTLASLGEEKYPKTLKDMNAAIGKHPWDRKPDGQRNQKTKGIGKELQLAKTTNSEPICYCCGEKGHRSNKCQKKPFIAPNDWWINKQNNKAEESGETEVANETQNAQTKEKGKGGQEDPNREPSVSGRRSSIHRRRSVTPHPRKRCGGAFQMDEEEEG